MRNQNGEIIRPVVNFIAALTIMSVLLTALPGLRSINLSTKETVTLPVNMNEMKNAVRNMPDIKKMETEQRRTPVSMLRTIQQQAHTTADQIGSGESFRFAPDLGVQGGNETAIDERNQMKGQVFDENETDVRPVPVVKTTVPYPPEAQLQGIEGVADLEISIDESGRVLRIKCNQLPSELFRAPLMKTIMHWRFKPAQIKGVAVSVRVRQKITFKLSQTF
jgi:TonB family protein